LRRAGPAPRYVRVIKRLISIAVAAIALLIAGARGAMAQGLCVDPFSEHTNGTGSLTFYTLGGQIGNCNFATTGQNPDVVAHVATGAGQYFGAMNSTEYANAAVCGACVEISRDDGRKVTVTIVDQCPQSTNPGCRPGHIDLSQQAFLQVGSVNEGYLGTGNGGVAGVISWRYVACPVTENVTFNVFQGSNPFFLQVVVEGTRYPIAKVEILVNGVFTPMVRQSYNAWLLGQGAGAGPFSLRVTDVEGHVVTGQATLTPGTDQPTSSQFPLCAPAGVPALGARGDLLALVALIAAGLFAFRAARRRGGASR
jgi:expansin (peptidoglycan-binding protein)